MASPDGAFLAGHYNDAASRGERIALIPLAGGAVRKLPTVPATASWAPDGKSLIYIESHAGVSNLMRYSIASGAAVPLTKFTSDQIFGYAVSPDQKQVAAVRGRVSSRCGVDLEQREVSYQLSAAQLGVMADGL